MSPNVNLQMTETIKIKIVPANNDKVIVIYCLSNKIEKNYYKCCILLFTWNGWKPNSSADPTLVSTA